MSSIVVAGDTSGSVTISAPAVAGTPTLTLPTTSGTILTTTGGVAPGTNGNVLTSNGTTWTSAAPASGSMTLLGTVNATSGNSVSLGSLDLTGYKQLQIVFQSVYQTGASTWSYYITSDNTQNAAYAMAFTWGAGSTNAISGIANINLSNGCFTSTVGKDSDSSYGYGIAGKTNITTSTTTVYIRLNTTYTNSGGSFLIYGVK